MTQILTRTWKNYNIKTHVLSKHISLSSPPTNRLICLSVCLLISRPSSSNPYRAKYYYWSRGTNLFLHFTNRKYCNLSKCSANRTKQKNNLWMNSIHWMLKIRNKMHMLIILKDLLNKRSNLVEGLWNKVNKLSLICLNKFTIVSDLSVVVREKGCLRVTIWEEQVVR